MKKLIFGCILMISGIIGASGWLIAYASLMQDGAWSSMISIFNNIDGLFVLLFYAVAAYGANIAIKSLKEGK